MFSNFAIYLHAVFVQWGGIYSLVTLIPDVSTWVERDGMLASLSKALDKRITRTHRLRIYRSLCLIGIFFAGFFAWNEQYLTARDLRQIKPMAGIYSVPNNSYSVSVPLPHRITEPYSLSVTANWNTTVIIEDKQPDHFTVGFNTDAGSNSRIEWQLVPLNESD
jgi:hypothetical protein